MRSSSRRSVLCLETSFFQRPHLPQIAQRRRGAKRQGRRSHRRGRRQDGRGSRRPLDPRSRHALPGRGHPNRGSLLFDRAQAHVPHKRGGGCRHPLLLLVVMTRRATGILLGLLQLVQQLVLRYLRLQPVHRLRQLWGTSHAATTNRCATVDCGDGGSLGLSFNRAKRLD